MNHPFEPENDYDDYYGDPHEPYYLKEDQGWGQCPDCGSYLVNSGAVSDGDGDLYDELNCPLCQEQKGKANEKWFDNAGGVHNSEEEMWLADIDDDDYSDSGDHVIHQPYDD